MGIATKRLPTRKWKIKTGLLTGKIMDQGVATYKLRCNDDTVFGDYNFFPLETRDQRYFGKYTRWDSIKISPRLLLSIKYKNHKNTLWRILYFGNNESAKVGKQTMPNRVKRARKSEFLSKIGKFIKENGFRSFSIEIVRTFKRTNLKIHSACIEFLFGRFMAQLREWLKLNFIF